MTRLTLNADLGEGMANDADLMPLLDMANVACGGHAGDQFSMRTTLQLAAKHGVAIGAHPSYPDREGFGRRSLQISALELQQSLHQQMTSLQGIASELAATIRYVKPHGALYNDMMRDDCLLQQVLDVVAQCFPNSGFMLLASERHLRHEELCRQRGLTAIFEVFADRAYTPSGELVNRRQEGAVLTGEASIARVERLLKSGQIEANDGSALSMPMHSLCVHGDNPAALAVVQRIRGMLPRA